MLSNKVLYIDQSNETSEEQKTIARANIDAASTSSVNELAESINELAESIENMDSDITASGTNFQVKLVQEDGKITSFTVPLDSTVNATDVNSAISTALANYGGFKIVSLNPNTHKPDVAEPSDKFIYLTKDSSSTATDPYTEWIWVKGNPGRWEVIGETTVPIDNYYTKDESDGRFATKAQGTKADTALQSITTRAGSHYNEYRSEGPIITPSTVGTTSTLTFDYMKGPKGDTGPEGNVSITDASSSYQNITLYGNSIYKLSVGNKYTIFKTPSSVTSIETETNGNRLKITKNGSSISYLTVPYATSASQASISDLSKEVYNYQEDYKSVSLRADRGLFLSGKGSSEGFSPTISYHTSIDPYYCTIGLPETGPSKQAQGIVAAGTVNATNGLAVLQGSDVYLNLTKDQSTFNNAVAANKGLFSNFLIVADRWSGNITKGMKVDLDATEVRLFKDTDLSVENGNIVLGTGKLHGTATKAETADNALALNGWKLSVDSYSSEAYTISLV